GGRLTRPAWAARAGQAVLVGDHHQLGPVAGGELGHGPADVGLRRQRAHHQLGGDLVVGQPGGDQRDHLAFAVGEGGQPDLPRHRAGRGGGGRGAGGRPRGPPGPPSPAGPACPDWPARPPSPAAGWPAGPDVNAAISDRVTLGASSASPRATTRTAWSSSSGSTSLTRKPLAPARSAPKTCSSSSNVVRTTTLTPLSWGSAEIRLVAGMPSTSGMRRAISTTSGPSSLASATATPPLGASPPTRMPSPASSSTRNPARTRAWSSASSTRIIGPPRIPRPRHSPQPPRFPRPSR